MKKVEIYTDGACSFNPGPGGYAAILIYNDHEKIVSGYEELTTNNRMEIYAILAGLRTLKMKCRVKIYSDSQYVVNAIEKKWIDKWEKDNWSYAKKADIKNLDLWKELLIEINKHACEFIKVKGHSDNVYNNRCDKIAREEIMNHLKINKKMRD